MALVLIHSMPSCHFLIVRVYFSFECSVACETVTMRAGGWYYKDRLGRTRGPMELINLKTAWAAGIVDKNTFIWGDDMDEWAPIGMVYGLQPAVETPDCTSILHFYYRISILISDYTSFYTCFALYHHSFITSSTVCSRI